MSLACSAGVSRLWKMLFNEHPPFEQACKNHDRDYKSAMISRAKADYWLRVFVAKTGYPKIAWIMWVGVRLGGWRYYGRK